MIDWAFADKPGDSDVIEPTEKLPEAVEAALLALDSIAEHAEEAREKATRVLRAAIRTAIDEEASALAALPYEEGLRAGSANVIAMLRDTGHPEIADAIERALAGDPAALAARIVEPTSAVVGCGEADPRD